eukprot:2842567-Prymnesium_polylepis.2
MPAAAVRWRRQSETIEAEQVMSGTRRLHKCTASIRLCVPSRRHGRAARTPQVRLDLNLTAQLMLDACLAQLRLVQHLQRDDEVRLLLARQVDLAKLPVAERLADVEVAQRPLAERLGGLLKHPKRTGTAPSCVAEGAAGLRGAVLSGPPLRLGARICYGCRGGRRLLPCFWLAAPCSTRGRSRRRP